MQYPNGALAEVICMRRLNSKNIFAVEYLVRLEVKPICSCDQDENCLAIPAYNEPKFVKSPNTPLPIPGCLTIQSNLDVSSS